MDEIYQEIALKHDMSLLLKLVWDGRAREAREHLAYFIDLKKNEVKMLKRKLLERISLATESSSIAVFTDGVKLKTAWASSLAGSIAIKKGELHQLPILGVYNVKNVKKAEEDLDRVFGD